MEEKKYPAHSLFAILFKREKDSQWEAGLKTEGANKDIIIDKYGEVLYTVWDYKACLPDFSINMTNLLEGVEQFYYSTQAK